jgi:hypothetical protein
MTAPVYSLPLRGPGTTLYAARPAVIAGADGAPDVVTIS